LRKFGAPGAEAFAVLFAIESLARAVLATVIPLQALDMLGDARSVSVLFFAVSCVGLCGSLTVPWMVRRSARRWIYSAGALLIMAAGALLAIDGIYGQVTGMMARVLGTVALTICVNLYIMDNIPRREFTRLEPKRMFYSAGAWTIGPILGVYLRNEVAEWAPYVVSSATAAFLLAYFWFLRMTERPVFSGPADRAPGPLANVQRFVKQPRLLLAWLTAIGRNVWWAVFFIYAPIFAVQSGLGEMAGGIIVSIGSGFLFLIPLWGWCVRRLGLRFMLIAGFTMSGVATLLAAVLAGAPWAAVAMLLIAAFAMVAIDAVGNVPFMLSVRPRERAEMTSVYNTYRDVAEMAPPGILSILLRFLELPVVFVSAGVAVFAVAGLSRHMHPRLGLPHVRPERKTATLIVGQPAAAVD
jgi:MFS family permease